MDPAVESDQETENEQHQDQVALLNGCLSRPEILSAVLRHFSNEELIKLSTLNKLSNLEARRIMKARGDIIATTKETNTCEDLEDFATGLQLMRIMPFAGFIIKLGGQHECSRQALPGHELTVVCQEVLDRIDWNILKVQFLSDWNKHEDCPGFVLLKKILRMCSTVFQEFSLLVIQNQRPFVQDVLQEYAFSNLSTLKFRDKDVYTSSEEYTNFIKELVSRAPNLRTLHTEGLVDLKGNLLEGSRAVHVTDYPYSPSLDEIPESIVSSIRLKRMRLIDITEDFSRDRFNRIAFTLLDASRTTLFWIHLDLPFLLPLMAYGIRLDNVRKLNLNIDNYCDLGRVNPNTWKTMQSFDFNRVFPSLDTVCVRAECHPLSFPRLQHLVFTFLTMVPQWGWGMVPLGRRALNVKNLDVNIDSEFTSRTAKHVAQMFPNVKRLSIRAKRHIPFHVIWSHWPHLEELDVAIVDRYVTEREKLDRALPTYAFIDPDYVHVEPEDCNPEDWVVDPEHWDNHPEDWYVDVAKLKRLGMLPESWGMEDASDDGDMDPEEPSNIMETDPTPSLELDGDFCGIHPEEVTELREQVEDDLRNVEIVPVKPSIANLKNLRTLTISLESTRSDLRIDPLIWFSRVTPLIAFKKCPNLQVTVRTDDEEIYEALSALKPYVPVLLDNLN